MSENQLGKFSQVAADRRRARPMLELLPTLGGEHGGVRLAAREAVVVVPEHLSRG